LDLALTCEGTYKDRVLGKNLEAMEVPMRTVFFCTGNNVVFRADTAPRCVPIALDPRMEFPEQRTGFAHADLLAWVKEQRPALVTAALTLMHAFLLTDEADRPVISALGGFEGWNALVRRALIWAGEADPLAGQHALALNNDTATDPLRNLLEAWSACYGAEAKTFRQAKLDIEQWAQTQGPPNQWNDLKDAICAYDPYAKGGAFDPEKVGNTVRVFKGRVVNGLRWEQGEKRQNRGWPWRVSQLPLPGTTALGQNDPQTPVPTECSCVASVAISPVRTESVREEEEERGERGERQNMTLTGIAGETATPATQLHSTPESPDVPPCAVCGGMNRWNDAGTPRCMACYPPSGVRTSPTFDSYTAEHICVDGRHSLAIRDGKNRTKERYCTTCQAIVETWDA
jgi:hypothetical protein